MALSNVPPHLTIRILHSDDDIVVIDKPCDLRSVPGHKYPPPPEEGRRRPPDRDVHGEGDLGPRSHRRTAQEAWVSSIQLLGAGGHVQDGDGHDSPVEGASVAELITNLGTTAKPDCVPRKLETFVRYCNRNSHRLLPNFTERNRKKSEMSRHEPVPKKQKMDGSDEVPSLLRSIAQRSYAKIQQQQRFLLKLPTRTEDGESALGQLHLLGFGDHGHRISGTDTPYVLHVVHRLDCATSGIMVVARHPAAAAFLCKAWKERETVRKVYLAHVRRWPPYHDHRRTEGTIDVPLAPSQTERIRWEVRPGEGGKECKTYWKVYEDLDKVHRNDEEGVPRRKGITLELHPITGRTHQLRLHCAAVGSGIVGDTLYGDAPSAWRGNRTSPKQGEDVNLESKKEVGTFQTLRLHAHKLVLPNPHNENNFEFESPKPW